MHFVPDQKSCSASVHNSRNQSCNGTGIKHITVETRTSDREVGGSGAGGSIPDLLHQKPGKDSNNALR